MVDVLESTLLCINQ